VKPIAEIRGRSRDSVRAGTLRSGDLEAFAGLLEKIGEGSVVLVSGAGDGRLAASTGLASAAAASGARTVLVDCDLEDPTIAGALGLLGISAPEQM
jgi:Mrp family chromosome partitioning ATPase